MTRLTDLTDTTDREDVASLIDHHVARFGSLGVLVNGAGSVGLGGVADADVTELDRLLEQNVRATWLVTQTAIPHLRAAAARSGSASIITIGSILGRHGSGAVAAYSASKAALFGLMQAVHDELADERVRATTIAPAFVATPMTEPLAHLDRSEMIQPGDVAETVRYLTRLSGTCAVPEVLLLRTADRLLAL